MGPAPAITIILQHHRPKNSSITPIMSFPTSTSISCHITQLLVNRGGAIVIGAGCVWAEALDSI